jgi:hypothetical protein
MYRNVEVVKIFICLMKIILLNIFDKTTRKVFLLFKKYKNVWEIMQTGSSIYLWQVMHSRTIHRLIIVAEEDGRNCGLKLKEDKSRDSTEKTKAA